MWFGEVPVARAEGTILAHSVQVGERRLRKGVVLDADHIKALAGAGVDSVTVARAEPGDVTENDGATRLAAALVAGETGLRASVAATGRVNLYATERGVARIDRERIDAVNRIDPGITVATVREWAHLAANDMAATIKIITYAVPGAALASAETAAAGGFSVAPVSISTATLIETVIAGTGDGKGPRAMAARLETLGIDLKPVVCVRHDAGLLAQALRAATADAATGAGADLLLILTGSATSDLHDVAPQAVRMAGGTVHHFGMPVDPGNLLFLGELAGRPVIGLPSCARSPALNGADWVLERIVCGVPVSAQDIMGMGVGGLLKEIPTRPRPRESR